MGEVCEVCLPVEYTSIEEISRNKRSNIPPGDHNAHEEETEYHASRLSTLSTVYQGLQAKDRNKDKTASSGLEIEDQTQHEKN